MAFLMVPLASSHPSKRVGIGARLFRQARGATSQFFAPARPTPARLTADADFLLENEQYCRMQYICSGVRRGYGQQQNRHADLSDRSELEGGIARRSSRGASLHREHDRGLDSWLLRAARHCHPRLRNREQEWRAFMIKTVKQACRFNPVIQDYRMSQGIENLADLIHDAG